MGSMSANDLFVLNEKLLGWASNCVIWDHYSDGRKLIQRILGVKYCNFKAYIVDDSGLMNIRL